MDDFSSGGSSNTSVSSNDQSALTFFPRSYAMSGKIMLSVIVILFGVVLLILCLHVYARWYLLRRQQRRRRRRQRRVLVFSSDLRHAHTATAASATTGLDPAVLSSLPVFEYAAPADSEDDDGEEEMECAVCLCEFREKDRGRTLPGCKHSFHIECIDMWFSSHSTCPLCRSKVEPPRDPIAIQTRAPKPCDLCDSCRGGSPTAPPCSSSSPGSSASSGEHRVEAPPMRVGEEFKPPVSRILTIRSILSSDSRFHCAGAGGASAAEEPDLESGEGPAAPPPPPPSRRA